MDYNEHERTYENFIKFSKVGTVVLLSIVLCLAMFGFGGTAGSIAGTIMTTLNLVACGVGLASKKSPMKVPVIAFVVTGLLTIVTVI